MALALLCRTPTGLACVVSWNGLLPQLERLCSRERLAAGGNASGTPADQYMAAAVAGLVQQMTVNVVPLLHQASAAARAACAAGATRHRGGSSSSGSSSSGALQPLEALLQLLGSAAFRTVVVCDGLITGLADMLTREVSSTPAAAASEVHHELKVTLRKGRCVWGRAGAGGARLPLSLFSLKVASTVAEAHAEAPLMQGAPTLELLTALESPHCSQYVRYAHLSPPTPPWAGTCAERHRRGVLPPGAAD